MAKELVYAAFNEHPVDQRHSGESALAGTGISRQNFGHIAR